MRLFPSGSSPTSCKLLEGQGREVTWDTTYPLSHSHRQLEQLEVKRSGLVKELVEVREALSCATLQRDMLQAEKAEVAEALTKVGPWLSHSHRPAPDLGPKPSHWPQTGPDFRMIPGLFTD
jgi:hypothetical protein